MYVGFIQIDRYTLIHGDLLNSLDFVFDGIYEGPWNIPQVISHADSKEGITGGVYVRANTGQASFPPS